MFGLFKFTALMLKGAIGVTATVGKAAGATITAGVISNEAIKNKKTDSDMKKEERTSYGE